MRDNMTVDDAINVVHVLGRDLASNGDEDLGQLVSAATSLISHVQQQAAELERERARRRGTDQREAAVLEGHRLENGVDVGGRRDFLAGRGVHAGETLYLLTYRGWHPVRYESNMPRNEPLLYLPLPGVREEVVFCVPREARLCSRRNCGSRRDSKSRWTPSPFRRPATSTAGGPSCRK